MPNLLIRDLDAEVFERKGCTIGPDHQKALEVRRKLNS